MSDLGEVEGVLVSTITQVVYPNGTGSPSIIGAPCIVYRGWPIPSNLDKDLAAGKVNISVYPNDNEQKTTRYPGEWQPLPVQAPALTLTVSGTTITVGGMPSSPLNAAAMINGTGYVYTVQPGDTLTGIATGLASLINEDTPATNTGPVISIPGAYRIAADVGAVGTALREIKRQKRSFQITFWCPNPTVRDAIAAPVDAALANVAFLSLPDGSAGRLIYERSRVSDRVEREGLYRRDLFYSVEYGTTDSKGVAQIVAAILNMTDALGDPLPLPQPAILPQLPDAFLLESGAYMLMEDGSRLLIEAGISPPGILLMEDGSYLLLETGNKLLLES